MRITPYSEFGSLRLGVTTPSECISYYGEPTRTSKNLSGLDEYHYDEFIVRFDAQHQVVRECTLLPRAAAIIAGIELTWDKAFLNRACEQDPNPRNVYGFIVFTVLGIAVTGIHDEDDSQLAVTTFSEGAFDQLLLEAVVYEPERLDD